MLWEILGEWDGHRTGSETGEGISGVIYCVSRGFEVLHFAGCVFIFLNDNVL